MNPYLRKATGRKRVVVAALVSACILAVLAMKAEIRLHVIGEQFRRADWQLLAATLTASAAFHVFVGADKWWRILRAQGASVRYWEVFRVRLGSDPVRFAVPLKAGELVNAAYFGRLESLGFSKAAGSVLFDKALNLFGAVFWLYVGFAAVSTVPVSWELAVHTVVGTSTLVLICSRRARGALIGLAGILHPKLRRAGKGVLSAFEEFSPRQKVGFLIYGILFQLRPLAVCALLFIAFQPAEMEAPSARQFLAYGSVVVLMSNVPSMGGIGPREAALMEMFRGFADPTTLLTVGLSMSFAVQVFPALLGIPLMFPLLRDVASGTTAAAEEEAQAKAVRREQPVDGDDLDKSAARSPSVESDGLPSPSPMAGDDSAWI